MVQTKVKVGEVEINVERVGKGPQVILCLPGALGFVEHDFGSVMNLFDSEKFTVVIWDAPGFGKSRPPDRDFSAGVEYYIRDSKWAFEIMQVLGFSKYSVLGWSDGAITALFMAADCGEGDAINKLVIWGGRAFITVEDNERNKQFADIDSWIEAFPRRESFMEMYGEDYFRQAVGELSKLYLNIYEEGGNICKEKLGDINCRVLILHGTDDGAVSLSHAKFLEENITLSRLQLIPDAHHDLHLEYPDLFVDFVGTFLDP